MKKQENPGIFDMEDIHSATAEESSFTNPGYRCGVCLGLDHWKGFLAFQ